MLEVDDDGNPATWGDHVTDEEYAAAPAGKRDLMRATVMYAAGDVRVEDVPDAQLVEATDALVRVTRSAICRRPGARPRLHRGAASGRPRRHDRAGARLRPLRRARRRAGRLPCDERPRVDQGDADALMSQEGPVSRAFQNGVISPRAQPFGSAGQLAGAGCSIRRVNPAGRKEATTVTRSTVPSFRTRCVLLPSSTKPWPASTT